MKNKWNRWIELFESNKNSMINWRSNVSLLSNNNANFYEKSKCFEYLNEKSIVFVENCKKLKKYRWNFHFQLNKISWLIDEINQKTIKFLIAMLMNNWYFSCVISWIDIQKTLINIDLILIINLIIMLSFVIFEMWIEFFKNQNA